MLLLSRWLTNSFCGCNISLTTSLFTRPSSQQFMFACALSWRSFPQPCNSCGYLHHEMSNVCLMGVGEASIKLIVDHWVNFSYLENPSFPKCCECGGCDGRLWVKTERRLASNTALRSGKTFMGFTDSNDGDDEVLVLMIVLVWRSDFSVFISGAHFVHDHGSACDTVHCEV